ncbi:hypothetical protein J6590_063599 [Homalodisca vitripennis]|nr:hypothetical protein J6590_063599 [Homalodisca vitripennis]
MSAAPLLIAGGLPGRYDSKDTWPWSIMMTITRVGFLSTVLQPYVFASADRHATGQVSVSQRPMLFVYELLSTAYLRKFSSIEVFAVV